jgi:hypothetical protein
MDHSSTAGFRVWGSALSAQLDAIGLTKTADTGQIDWLTTTIPGTSTAAGYEIRYLNDSLHGTNPIILKIEYGTGSAGRPSMWVTAGSSSNGTGTIGGTSFLPRTQIGSSVAPTVSTYPLFACKVDGCAWFSAFRRYSVDASLFFAVVRTVNSTGSPTADGVMFFFTQATTIVLQRRMFINGVLQAVDTSFSLIPHPLSATIVSGNPTVYRAFYGVPDSVVIPYFVTFYAAEIGTETTFSLVPVGVTSRTFLSLSDAAGPGNTAQGGANANNNRSAWIWE